MHLFIIFFRNNAKSFEHKYSTKRFDIFLIVNDSRQKKTKIWYDLVPLKKIIACYFEENYRKSV